MMRKREPKKQYQAEAQTTTFIAQHTLYSLSVSQLMMVWAGAGGGWQNVSIDGKENTGEKTLTM